MAFSTGTKNMLLTKNHLYKIFVLPINSFFNVKIKNKSIFGKISKQKIKIVYKIVIVTYADKTSKLSTVNTDIRQRDSWCY